MTHTNAFGVPYKKKYWPLEFKETQTKTIHLAHKQNITKHKNEKVLERWSDDDSVTNLRTEGDLGQVQLPSVVVDGGRRGVGGAHRRRPPMRSGGGVQPHSASGSGAVHAAHARHRAVFRRVPPEYLQGQLVSVRSGQWNKELIWNIDLRVIVPLFFNVSPIWYWSEPVWLVSGIKRLSLHCIK